MAGAEEYDLTVIGAGPGGYVACVRAAQLGLKTVCVEKEPRLGGVCLNVGCIPSKALLDSSEHYYFARERMAEHGVRTGEIGLDLAVMMARKEKVVKDLCQNVQRLLEGNKVEIVQGRARLAGEGLVEVTESEGGGRRAIKTRTVLLASGSEPVSVSTLPFDGARIVSSTEALSFDEVPERLGIVGGGYIGLELGSVWRRLGSKVTVIEMMPKIAASLDGQLGRALERILAKQGMDFRLNTKVLSADKSPDGVSVIVESGGREEKFDFDKLLVAVGRRPLTRDLGLEKAGVKTDPKTGQVLVDARYRTSAAGVYAIGDLIAGPMLAHKASAEGIAAVECIAGLPGEVNYDAIPSVVYTSPEVASVGMTEEQAKERGVKYCVGSYPFSGAGRARCMGETDGFVKIITHALSDRLLGAHIIGPRASELIAECALALELSATSEDIARTVHGHPTFAEAVHEAAMASKKCSIHVP